MGQRKFIILVLITTFLMGIAFPVGKMGLAFAPPFLFMGFRYLLDGRFYRVRAWIGVLIGFAGVFVTFGFHLQLQSGTLIGLLGAVCFAVATLLVKHWGHAFHSQVLSAYQMVAGGIGLLVLSVITERLFFTITLPSIAVMMFLVILCSIIQTFVWYYLLQQRDPGATSSFLFLAPIFGVLTSWMLLGEQANAFIVLGGLLICVGVFLVNWRVKVRNRHVVS